jgi:hypothetical protein
MTTTRSQHPALVVMDPRLDAVTDLWDAHSTITEASPRAGMPVPTSTYAGSLRGAGVPTEATTIRVQTAGLPGGEQGAATFVASPDGTSNWSGWEGPGAISQWEALSYSTSAANYRITPHVAVSPAGSLVASARVGSGSGITLETYTRTAGSTTWGSAVTVNARGQTPYAPCVLAVGARLMLFAAVEDTVSGLAYIWSWSSADDGATWSIASAPAARDFATVLGVTGSSIRRIRAAYANGQIILFLHTLSGTTNTTYQYASSDLGASFQRVATLAGEGFGDVVAVDGQFLHISGVFGAVSASSYSTRIRRYGSAYQGPQSAVVTSALSGTTALGSGYLTDAGSATVSLHNGFALVRDDTGVVYAFGVHYTADPDAKTHRGQVMFSEDVGQTWAPWGVDTYSASDAGGYDYSARWWGPNTAASTATAEAVSPTAISAVYWRGRVAVAHNWRAPTSTLGNSLGIAYLGGMSRTVTLPPTVRAGRYADQASYDQQWLPFELPGNLPQSMTFTQALSGAASLASPGRLNITSSGIGGVAYVTMDDPYASSSSVRATEGDTLIAECAFRAMTGVDTSTDRIAFKCRVDNGVYGYQISVRQNTVAIVVYDDITGLVIATTSLIDEDIKTIRVGMDGASASAAIFWRYWKDDDTRGWTHLGTVTGLTSDGGTVGNHRIQWGQFSGAFATTIGSRWYFAAASFGARAGYANVGSSFHWDDYSAGTMPTQLTGRQIAPAPLAVFARAGLSISALRGPFFTGQTWTVSPDAAYAARRVLPQIARSPRIGWRSTADNTELKLAFQLQATGADSAPVAPVMAVILRGINWRTGAIEARVGGTWTEVAAIDAALNGATYAFTRTGDTIMASGYSAADPYLATGELRGWTAQYDTARRRIRHNTEGKLSGTTYAGPLARILVEGADTGTPTTGNLRLWAPDVAVLFPFTQNADGWRIVIDAQNTADDFYTIGQLLIGPLHLLAQPYSWGRTQTTERGSVIQIQPDRTTYLSRPAPARRVIQMTWADGVDETAMWASSPVPDYPDYDSGDASNANAATLQSLSGLLNEADGRMVALLPKVTMPLSTTQTIWRKAGIIVGTASAEDQIDTIQGDELTDEVVRSGNLVITEEV